MGEKDIVKNLWDNKGRHISRLAKGRVTKIVQESEGRSKRGG